MDTLFFYNKYWLVLLIVFIHLNLNAQIKNIPLNKNAVRGLEAQILKQDDSLNLHTAIQPFNHFKIAHLLDTIHENIRFEKEIDKKFPRWLFNAFFNDHFAKVEHKEGKYSLYFNPLVDIRMGSSSDTEQTPFVNSRGLQIMGQLGKTMTFYTDLYENQARFPNYVDEFIQETTMVPGEGNPKNFNSTLSESPAYDFSYANGNITIQPNEFFNIQFGHGKHFIGEGYRSLFLSDNAFNYPYLRIQTTFWKINYTNLFTQMRDAFGSGHTSFPRKYVSSHYLSMNVTKKFNIGLFETVVYQDSTNTLDVSFLNPVILYRPVEFAVGSGNGNVMMGIAMSYKIRQKMMIYNQIMFDEFLFEHLIKADGWWGNKIAFQLGFKSYDTFIKGLYFQTELNYVRPYTYTHQTTGRNYGHYGQAIAHPLGANFIESVNILAYQKGRWSGEIELMYAIQGRDTLDSNWGSNIFESYDTREQEFDNKTTQGVRSTTLFTDIRLAYIVNPKTNLRLELGATFRNFSPANETVDLKNMNTTFIHFGIRTALTNKYYDF